MTDEEIVALYLHGDDEAFRELIRRYTSSIYNFVVRISGRNDRQNNAQDIVQETFIKVWKNIRRFDPAKASFKTWIFTIAKNSATDFLRKKRSVLFSDLDVSTSAEKDKEENSFIENIPDDNLLPDEALQKLEDREFLNKTLEKLRPNYSEILALHYQENMTFEEIGEVLGKPLNTVKSDHRRAILELRELLS